MSSLWDTLIKPDHDEIEMSDRLIVITAANQLQIGEFQLLQLAYREWFDHDLPEALVAKLFTSYMLHHEVPHWARHYARRIIDGCERGDIDDNAPRFHRYDHDYRTSVPQGVQRFCFASACILITVFGSIYLANQMVDSPMSLLPPYFEKQDFRRGPQDARFEAGGREKLVAPGGDGDYGDSPRPRD
ncbi:MAG TPA: hypothetical protein VI457_02335 [Methylococcaceae bacterium]|nr:hypothetical protein [Methylococcaceae bacterium]